MKTKHLSLFVSGLTLAPLSLSAAVTYVDATINNTVGAASGLVDWNDGSADLGDGTANADGLWRFRGGFGNNGIWEATGSSATAEDAAEIVTSATVPNALYDVFVFYYAVNESGDFPIRAGLSSNPNGNPIFDRAGNRGTAGGDTLAELTFDVAPPTGGESRTLLYGQVGQIEVTDGSLEVFIDDFPASSTGTSNDRTWYQGIGYEVIPEPSSAVLGALGALALLGRRRR